MHPLCSLLAVLFLVAAHIFPSAAYAAENAQSSLRVGLEDYYPPFAFTDKGGKHTGFDQEVAEALCQTMARPCAFVILPLDSLIEAMKGGHIDLLVAGLADTEERKAFMDFSETYFRSRSVYLGNPSKVVVSKAGLAGKKLGVQAGTIQEQYARENWRDTATIIVASYGNLLKKLTDGEVDAVLVEGLAGYEFLKSERGCAFEVLDDPLPANDLTSQSHIGVRKGAEDLLADLNQALVSIRLNGEFNRINRKYFPFSVY